MSGNIADYFAQHLATPGRVLYRHFAAGGWRDATVADLAALVGRWQAAFAAAGLVQGDRVALCARNGLHWVAVDLAALGLGLVVVPLYVDDNVENIAWCIADVEAKLVVVDSLRLANGLAKGVAQDAPPLPPLVVLRAGHDEAGRGGATPVERFLPERGGEVVVRPLPPPTLATICYTSGTGGRPKGVMLSHANIVANVASCAATGLARPDDRFLSMLPLSHMFERTGGYYLPLSLGAEVAFARGIAQLAEDLATQAPTVVFAVPRIFERFKARIDQTLARSTAKRLLFDQCVERGFRVAQRRASLLDHLLVPALRALVAAPILDRLGGRLRLAVVGGAALDPALSRVFIGLGLAMLQGYGMTEASPVISVNRVDDNDPASVGAALPGIEVGTLPSGELLVRGANVMLGYWRNEPATQAALDADGWLHSGDLAEIRDGRIHILGRAKDVLVLSNGEKLPPQDVELAILHDSVFEQVMLVGEGRPFVVLLAVSREKDERLLVRRANEQLKGFPRWIRVRRVLATTAPWSVDTGLLTPTLKLRRPQVLAQFRERIDAAYAGTTGE
ncbi:MAG: AMP-binding protein [Betaproteobacteria bacterium]|nr:AMP-binding protein [Betaproteobacteria bacterium]